MNVSVRQEQPSDYQLTEKVIERAFSTVEISDKTEHEMVSLLRRSEAFVPELSLVAEGNEIVGHILLTKVNIVNENEKVESLALAPVSVVSEFQSKGIGKRLIEEALRKAKELGFESVIVLGHPTYYPKFGFKKASILGIKPPFEVPDEVFMALELKESALDGVSGVVEYPREFFGG
ncbi:putative N-acetyltransferase YhbS [Bacillus tianshenii]|uniref:N-acetyltransferase YhbS n=1 Tax=Sutcliffiella tianshenii TaxID=1463404 RepID=A0ABS2P2P3_9BACI|nr:N-acetyltransferase [Bacillus tianshenii]MBM7621224.1 putative N-acetyltransferase YhbS [Bacillus tianshenii]